VFWPVMGSKCKLFVEQQPPLVAVLLLVAFSFSVVAALFVAAVDALPVAAVIAALLAAAAALPLVHAGSM
jgi:hypothetical protein